MQRLNLSADDLSRLIDGLEGTSHLDSTEREQEHSDKLLARLVTAFEEEQESQATTEAIAQMLFA